MIQVFTVSENFVLITDLINAKINLITALFHFNGFLG